MKFLIPLGMVIVFLIVLVAVYTPLFADRQSLLPASTELTPNAEGIIEHPVW